MKPINLVRLLEETMSGYQDRHEMMPTRVYLHEIVANEIIRHPYNVVYISADVLLQGGAALAVPGACVGRIHTVFGVLDIFIHKYSYDMYIFL